MQEMRATGKVSRFVWGNVAQYGVENAEMRNSADEERGLMGSVKGN